MAFVQYEQGEVIEAKEASFASYNATLVPFPRCTHMVELFNMRSLAHQSDVSLVLDPGGEQPLGSIMSGEIKMEKDGTD